MLHPFGKHGRASPPPRVTHSAAKISLPPSGRLRRRLPRRPDVANPVSLYNVCFLLLLKTTFLLFLKISGNFRTMASADSQVDLEKIPLVALNMTVRKKLGLYLNPKHTVAADWTALAEAVGFTYLEIKNYEVLKNPTGVVLEDWQARTTEASVGKLLSILSELDREDIVEDLRPLISALLPFQLVICL